MEQGSDNWLAWRATGLGSSDAPVIMGVSPWKTPHQLWEEKAGIVKREQTANWATDRGNRLEPIARARYELESDVEMPPATCKHYQYEFLLASMDGWNPKLKKGLEIKCPGRPDHEKAMAGNVPEKYYPQLQHQIMVTGAESIDYYSYYVPKGVRDDQGESVTITVKPDLDYIRDLFKKELDFWECIQNKESPGFQEKDFKKVRLLIARRIAVEWKELSQNIAHLETALLEYGPRSYFQGTGVRVNDGIVECFQEEKSDDDGTRSAEE